MSASDYAHSKGLTDGVREWGVDDIVLPYKRHIPSILQMTAEETADLATILKKVLVRYDNLFS